MKINKIRAIFKTPLGKPFGNYALTTFIGYKEGCSYCGKPLKSKYKFCPFREPITHSCERYLCRLRQYIILRWFILRNELAKIIKPIELKY